MAQAIPVLLLSSIIVFAVLQLAPGDPALLRAGPEATLEEIEKIREEFELDRPVVVQYWTWLTKALRGDFGASYVNDQPALEMVLGRFPATLELAAAAIVVFTVAGIGLGSIAAVKRDTPTDGIATTISSVMISIPNYWFGILSILVFALWLGWLPAGGRIGWGQGITTGLKHLVLPAFALAFTATGTLARFTRNSMVDRLDADYVRAAMARGISRGRRVRRYVLRNAAIPIITVIGIFVGRMLGGAVVIESVFGWPGLGRLLVRSISMRDYNVVQAILLLMVTLFVVVNVLVDIVYGIVNPRARSSASDKP
jgi:ABC-type dipeptide/oligopeptide/nickel transport system permease component